MNVQYFIGPLPEAGFPKDSKQTKKRISYYSIPTPAQLTPMTTSEMFNEEKDVPVTPASETNTSRQSCFLQFYDTKKCAEDNENQRRGRKLSATSVASKKSKVSYSLPLPNLPINLSKTRQATISPSDTVFQTLQTKKGYNIFPTGPCKGSKPAFSMIRSNTLCKASSKDICETDKTKSELLKSKTEQLSPSASKLGIPDISKSDIVIPKPISELPQPKSISEPKISSPKLKIISKPDIAPSVIKIQKSIDDLLEESPVKTEKNTASPPQSVTFKVSASSSETFEPRISKLHAKTLRLNLKSCVPSTSETDEGICGKITKIKKERVEKYRRPKD